jgi:hypothetical protein
MPTHRQQKRLEVQRQIIKHFDEKLPSFTDVFDERSFYIFVACIAVLSIGAVILLSYCCQVKLDDADELRKLKEKKERKRKEKLAVKLLKDKIKNAKHNSEEYNDLKEKLEILEKKIKEANSRSKNKTFIDDTDYEFSDEDDGWIEAERDTSNTTLKSE